MIQRIAHETKMVLAIDLGRPRRDDEPPGPLGGCRDLGRALTPLVAVVVLWCVARMFVFESPWADPIPLERQD